MIPGALVDELRAIVGRQFVLVNKEDVIVYEQDGSILQAMPEIVVVPANAAEVSAVVRAATKAGVPIVPRGSGTGLAGGAVPAEGGVVLSLARLDRILEIDLENRIAGVEPGVINLEVTKAITKDGFFYAPDPSSQAACSVGGNIANNSGGPHTLAYGVTVNHVLGLEVVLADGSVVWLGGRVADTPGYDLTGVFVGSEGTMGGVTKAVGRLGRLSAGRGSGAARRDRRRARARRARHGGDPVDLQAKRRARGQAGARRYGAAATLERAQGLLRRTRPHRSELLRSGRRRPARQTAGDHGERGGDRRALRPHHR